MLLYVGVLFRHPFRWTLIANCLSHVVGPAFVLRHWLRITFGPFGNAFIAL